MHKLCEYIDDELEDLERKAEKVGKLSEREVVYGKDLAKFKSALLTNKAMEERDDDYSEEGRRNGGMSRNRREDMSGARNRDSRGRFSRDGFMDKLMEMRESAPNEKTRRAVDKMIDELEN